MSGPREWMRWPKPTWTNHSFSGILIPCQSQSTLTPRYIKDAGHAIDTDFTCFDSHLGH